jgi:hypothetical protein
VTWGLVLIAAAAIIGWRRLRIDATSVVTLLVAIGLALAYTYKSLGG